MELGTANYDGGSKKKRFKIDDGDNIYRILPPMGSLAKKGKWSQYYSVVWGYANKEGKKRPFSDCRQINYKTKMVDVESAAYLKLQKLKSVLASLKEKQKNGENVSPDLIKKSDEMIRNFNIENKHFINVINLKGEIGVLKIGAKAKKLLEEEIKKLTSRSIDPLSLDNGRFFNIFRSGRGNETVYQVTVHKQIKMSETGEEMETPVVHKIDQAIISRLDSEAFDLGSLYPKADEDQVKAIVGGADPDLVLGLGNRNEESEESETEEDSVDHAVEAKDPEPVKEEVKVEAPVQKPVEQPKVEKAPEPAKELSHASGTSLASMSDEDFLKQMGIGA